MTISLEHTTIDEATERNFQRLAQLAVDTGGRTLGLRVGVVNVSTSAAVSGSATVTHGLGKTPLLVLATAQNSSASAGTIAQVTSVTSATFVVGIRYGDGTARTTTIIVGWMAIG